MQVQNQVTRTTTLLMLSSESISAMESAKTKPLATSVTPTLIKTMKKPQCHLSYGTSWQGPTFKNLEIPIAAEMIDNAYVVVNLASSKPDVLLKKRSRLFSLSFDIISIAVKIKTVGTASMKGSEKQN